MDIYGLLQKLRHNNGYLDFEKNLQKFQRIMDILQRAGPFIGRILTRKKHYSGRIEKLALENNQLEFIITDCNSDGKTSERSETYRKNINWKDDLKDIQVFFSGTGENLSFDDLVRGAKETEAKNE